MADPLELREELERALTVAAREGTAYATALPGEPVLMPGTEALVDGLDGPLPEPGAGATPEPEAAPGPDHQPRHASAPAGETPSTEGRGEARSD